MKGRRRYHLGAFGQQVDAGGEIDLLQPVGISEVEMDPPVSPTRNSLRRDGQGAMFVQQLIEAFKPSVARVYIQYTNAVAHLEADVHMAFSSLIPLPYYRFIL